jgi:hypothetical protein
LSAIYGEDHIQLERSGESSELRISLEIKQFNIVLLIRFSKLYPNETPIEMKVLCKDQKITDEISSTEKHLRDAAEAYVSSGDPYVMNLILTLQDSVEANWSPSIVESVENGLKSDASEIEEWLALIKLDHMRNRQKYLKTLRKWSKESTLHVTVIIFKSSICVVVLEGSRSDIDGFMVKWKTQCIGEFLDQVSYLRNLHF